MKVLGVDQRRWAFKFLALQLLGVIIISLSLLIFSTKLVSLSLICGGLSYSISNAVFGYVVFFRPLGARQAQQSWRMFCLGEAAKLLLFGLISYSLLSHVELDMLTFLAGLLVAQSAIVWAPVLLNRGKLN